MKNFLSAYKKVGVEEFTTKSIEAYTWQDAASESFRERLRLRESNGGDWEIVSLTTIDVIAILPTAKDN